VATVSTGVIRPDVRGGRIPHFAFPEKWSDRLWECVLGAFILTTNAGDRSVLTPTAYQSHPLAEV
jgi:hypothetical protein